MSDDALPVTLVQVSGKEQDGEETTQSTGLLHSSKSGVAGDVDRQFDELLQQLKDGVLDIGQDCDFVFKKRLTRGRPIHIAAMHPKGSSLLAKLIEKRSDVDEKCTAHTEDGYEQVLAPIHVAAGCGNTKAIEVLIAKGSDANLKTTSNGKEHYTALHEVAYFGVASAVSALIKAGADLDETNIHGQTPLHVSVKSGSWRVSSLLVDNDADLSIKDKDDQTALQTALVSSYPARKMFILSRLCMEDFMIVCGEDPGSAKALFSVSSSGIDWGKKWRQALTSPEKGVSLPSIEDLVTLCEHAPRSLGLLLDQLSVRPEEVDAFHHPMPKHAYPQMKGFGDWEWLQTTYTKQNKWPEKGFPDRESDEGFGCQFRYELCRGLDQRKNLKTQKTGSAGILNVDLAARGISYMNKLAKGAKKSERQELALKRVTIKMLHLPNIVDIDLMDALSHVSGEEDIKALFSREAVRALLDFCWGNFAKRVHNANLFLLLIELSTFVWLAVQEPGQKDEVGRNAAWSLVAAFSYRMLVKEFFAILGNYQHFGSPKYYFGEFHNWLEAGMAAVCLIYVHTLFHSKGLAALQTNHDEARIERSLLALAGFIRWVKLLTSLSAYSFLGPKILAITLSFFEIGGITIVSAFYFCAFAHTFAALRVTPADSAAAAKTIYEVALNSVKLLLAGDGDGINFVLGLGQRAEEGDWVTLLVLFGAIFLFVLCVLNLFIAVHGEAYGKAAENQTENFYAHRAGVCKKVMMQPSLPCCCSLSVDKIYCMIIVPGFAIWLGLVFIPWQGTRYIAAVQLLAHMLFADAVLVRPPWEVLENRSASKVSPASEPYTTPDGSKTEKEEERYYLWWFTFVKAEDFAEEGADG